MEGPRTPKRLDPMADNADNADNTLTAEPRSIVGSRPAGRLRREGKVPAVMYGLETDTANLTVPGRELTHILAGESGANTLITLEVDGEEHLALARQIQRHPTRATACTSTSSGGAATSPAPARPP